MRCFDGIVTCVVGRTEKEEASTLMSVVNAIRNMTGADVDGTTLLAECGLDSFGAGALIGLLREAIPQVKLTPVQFFGAETVADLAELIDAQLGAKGGANTDEHVDLESAM